MIFNYSTIGTAEFDELASEVSRQEGLRDVLAWASTKPQSERHSQIVAEVITQDEFTHDVIVPYKGSFLVYDTT